MKTATRRRTARLDLRASEVQKKTYGLVAEGQGVSVNDFILASADLQAEQYLADRHEVVLAPAPWQKFVEALERPAKAKPRLKRLLSRPSVLERP